MTEKSKQRMRAVTLHAARRQYISIAALLVALLAVILVIIFSSGNRLVYADTPTVREEIELRTYDYLRTGGGKDYGITEITDADTVLGFELTICEGVFDDAGISVSDDEMEMLSGNIQTAATGFAQDEQIEVNDDGTLTGLTQAHVAASLASAAENALTDIDMTVYMGDATRYSELSSSYMEILSEIDEQIGAVTSSTASVNEIYEETANAINETDGELTYSVDPDAYVDGETFNTVIEALRVELLAEIAAEEQDITEIYAIINEINNQMSVQLTMIDEAFDNIAEIMDILNSMAATDSDMDADISDIYSIIETIQVNLSTARTELETSDTSIKAELLATVSQTDESIRQLITDTTINLTNNIESVDNRITQRIDQLEEQNLADLEETRRLINELAEKEQDDVDQLTADIEEKYEELNNKIDENCEELTKNLEEATEEQRQALEEAVTDLKQQLSDTTDELNQKIEETRADLEQQLSDTTDTLNTKIDNTQTDLTNLITTTDNSIRQLIEETTETLNTYINDVDVSLQQKISDLEAQNLADLEETRRLIDELAAKEQSDYDALSEEIAEKYEELNDKIDENCEKFAQALEEATEEQRKALQEAVASLEQQLSDTTDMLESEISSLSDTLNTKIDDTKTELTNSLNQLSQSFSDFKTSYAADLSKLWAAINQNASDIAANAADIETNAYAISQLQTQLATFMASSDSHQKVDVIDGFTISASAWTVSSGYAKYVVTSDYLVDCTVVTVNYAQQYDITPTYSVNPTAGTLTISIPSSQKAAIVVSGIVVYHIYEDTPEEESGIALTSLEEEEESETASVTEESTETAEETAEETVVTVFTVEEEEETEAASESEETAESVSTTAAETAETAASETASESAE